MNISKNNITLPAESGTGKQDLKVCCFYFLHTFCYCKWANSYNKPCFLLSHKRWEDQVICRLLHLSALPGSPHSSWRLSWHAIPFFTREGQMFLTFTRKAQRENQLSCRCLCCRNIMLAETDAARNTYKKWHRSQKACPWLLCSLLAKLFMVWM